MKALLLDFGSVISKSLFERLPQIEKKLHLPKGTFTWRGALDPDSDPLWMSMQRDEITERDYWRLRSEAIGQLAGFTNWNFRDLMNYCKDQRYEDVLRPEALKIIELCKNAHLKVGILSNELALFYGQTWVDKLPFMPQMDCFFDATHNDILKPDPKAYQLAIDALGVPAKEILFVDDQLRNIGGAIRVGMRTLHFDIAQPKACFNYIAQVLNIPKNQHRMQLESIDNQYIPKSKITNPKSNHV
jgi:putative hydrolase of the HAD superfamily